MKIAVVGATGMVGTIMVKLLETREFPLTELILVASKKSVGKTVLFKGKKHTVVSLKTAVKMRPKIALFSAGSNTSMVWGPKFAKNGCLVLGICNGFQILTETGLLKGTLLRNKNLKFINKDIQ